MTPESEIQAMVESETAAWDRNDLDLSRSHELVHDRRRTVRVCVSSQGDGGFGVVDVATLGGSR